MASRTRAHPHLLHVEQTKILHDMFRRRLRDPRGNAYAQHTPSQPRSVTRSAIADNGHVLPMYCGRAQMYGPRRMSISMAFFEQEGNLVPSVAVKDGLTSYMTLSIAV